MKHEIKTIKKAMEEIANTQPELWLKKEMDNPMWSDLRPRSGNAFIIANAEFIEAYNNLVEAFNKILPCVNGSDAIFGLAFDAMLGLATDSEVCKPLKKLLEKGSEDEEHQSIQETSD